MKPPRTSSQGVNEERLFRVLGVCAMLLVGGLLYLHFTHRKAPPPPAQPQSFAPLTDIRGVTPPTRHASPVRDRSAHSRFDQAACLARTGHRPAPAQNVHRWVDAAGVVHYSDRPPASADIRDHTRRVADDTPPVTVTIDPVEARLPPHAISRAVADATAIGKVFKDVFELDTEGGLALRVTLAGSDAAFRRAAPRSPSASGVYMPGARHIVVRTQSTPEHTLDVLRHEITHALVHEWIGNLPTALNEGLADYFEHFEARGMGGQVDPERYARQMLQAATPAAAEPSLAHLLGLPHRNFHAYDRSENYARSLALVSTLMSDADGRRALGAVLREQRSRPCNAVDALSLLRSNAPRGFAHLAQRWQTHQRGDGLHTHAF